MSLSIYKERKNILAQHLFLLAENLLDAAFLLIFRYKIVELQLHYKRVINIINFQKDMLKPGPKRIAVSTGKPDRRQRDNKQTPGNTPSLKPHLHKKGD